MDSISNAGANLGTLPDCAGPARRAVSNGDSKNGLELASDLLAVLKITNGTAYLLLFAHVLCFAPRYVAVLLGLPRRLNMHIVEMKS